MSESGNKSLIKELLQFCRSDSLSEDGLREIIERHGLTKNNFLPSNHHYASDYDFFLDACSNESVNEGIIQCLLEYFPTAARATDEDGWSPLHFVCQNPNVTPKIDQLLIDAAPDSVRSVDIEDRMPLHHFCCADKELGEVAAKEILKMLLANCPESVRRTDNDGFLPIRASFSSSPEFCHVLIQAYLGSVRIAHQKGLLPIQIACLTNTLATVEYLYRLHPDAINHTTIDEHYPIHAAIFGISYRDIPEKAIDIVKFLLDCDPTVKMQKCPGGKSLLSFACQRGYNESKIGAGMEVIKVIYDAYPEAIEENLFVSNVQDCDQRVQAFVNCQLVYARQATDQRLMTAPDGNGQLPLHKALQNNVTLGSIKLLVKGNLPAIQTPDNNGALPLHFACAYHDSASVVQYLVGLDTTTLDDVDTEGNTALHFACRSARHEIIVMLLERYDAVSVSKRNAHGKLPIDLLWESDVVHDRESVEYTESVFRLLTAHPETLINVDTKQPTDADAKQTGKKRKLGAVEK